MMNIKNILTVAMCTFLGTTYAQPPKFSSPEKLAFNTTAEETFPICSPDGKTLYFARNFYDQNIGGKWGGFDIWSVSKDDNDEWVKESTLSDFNHKGNDVVVGLNDNGNELFFLNTNTKKPTPGISSQVLKENKWTTRKSLGINLKILDIHYGLYKVINEDVIFLSAKMVDGNGEEDLYVITKENNKWSSPVSLGNVINSSQSEISPFYDPKTKTLYFASNGLQGYGSYDIFMTQRTGDNWSTWSTPVNLGAEVNTSGYEAYLFMASNEDVFFTRNSGELTSDIYHTSIIIEEEPVEEKTPVVMKDTTPAIVAKTDLEPTKTSTLPEEKPLVIPTKSEVFFSLNSSQLSSATKDRLLKTVKTLQANKELQVSIIGFTCDRGLDEYNLQLSKRRAAKVQSFLLKAGVSANQIDTILGKGKIKTSQDKNNNRKVDIIYSKISSTKQ